MSCHHLMKALILLGIFGCSLSDRKESEVGSPESQYGFYCPSERLRVLDWEIDPSSHILNHADYLRDKLTEYGIALSFLSNSGAPLTNGLHIYDTNVPMDHPDLGTPNESCPGGGPGSGEGGQYGELFQNCISQGHVLVVQGDSVLAKDASFSGGSIVLEFHSPHDVIQLGILDIDNDSFAMIDVVTARGTATQTVGPTGSNGYVTVDVGVRSASKLVVKLPASSALTHIQLCLSNHSATGPRPKNNLSVDRTTISGSIATVPRHHRRSLAQIAYVKIDFSSNGGGIELFPGDYISNQYVAAFGLTVSAHSATGFTSKGPRLFDSSNPSASHLDLGAPNRRCPGGGPGRGIGGRPGEVFENCQPIGNVMIIQEEDTSVPDPDPTGGIISFNFDSPVDLISVGVLNLRNSSNTLTLNVAPVNGKSLSFTAPTTRANGFARVWIGIPNVKAIKFIFGGEGAITDVEIMRVPSKAPTTSPTFRRMTSQSYTTTSTPTTSRTTSPSTLPGELPTVFPTAAPTLLPTRVPTSLPSTETTPSKLSSTSASLSPTTAQTFRLSALPTVEQGAATKSKPTKPPNQASPKPTPVYLQTSTQTSPPSSSQNTNPSLTSTTHIPTRSSLQSPTSFPTLPQGFEPVLLSSKTPHLQPSNAPSAMPPPFRTQAPSAVEPRLPPLQVTNFPTFIPSGPGSKPTSTPALLVVTAPTLSPSGATRPTLDSTSIPSDGPSVVPSTVPSSRPSQLPIKQVPTISPIEEPTTTPTLSQSSGLLPSSAPSGMITRAPSTAGPTPPPTSLNSDFPSFAPPVSAASGPGSKPTLAPSQLVGAAPTLSPTGATRPTLGSTYIPSDGPSVVPSTAPSSRPSQTPIKRNPTVSPVEEPTTTPTLSQSSRLLPSRDPSIVNTRAPSTVGPTPPPTPLASDFPSLAPSGPVSKPTSAPSLLVVAGPTSSPYDVPIPPVGSTPSTIDGPSVIPSAAPSLRPSQIKQIPSVPPMEEPTTTPTLPQSSGLPLSRGPSVVNTPAPSPPPTSLNSDFPSLTPSVSAATGAGSKPTSTPSLLVVPTRPTLGSSSIPSDEPSVIPSTAPSSRPSQVPNKRIPSVTPMEEPTTTPTLSQSSGLLPSRVPSIVNTRAPSTVGPTPPPTPLASDSPSLAPTGLGRRPTSAPSLLVVVDPTSSPYDVPILPVGPTLSPSQRSDLVNKPACAPVSLPFLTPTSLQSGAPFAVVGLSQLQSVVPSGSPNAKPSETSTSFSVKIQTGSFANPSGLFPSPSNLPELLSQTPTKYPNFGRPPTEFANTKSVSSHAKGPMNEPNSPPLHEASGDSPLVGQTLTAGKASSSPSFFV